MISVYLSSQLGNMMFQYAAIKTIAQTKGVDFRYFRIDNTSYINSTDAKYGCELNTIFPIPKEEQIFEIPANLKPYQEQPPHLRNYPNYPKDVQNSISDNMLVRGFFITPEIFQHNISTIREWFSLPEPAVKKASNL